MFYMLKTPSMKLSFVQKFFTQVPDQDQYYTMEFNTKKLVFIYLRHSQNLV